MKQIKRSHTILSMVAIAIAIKAIQNENITMLLVSLVLVLFVLSRVLLFKKVVKEEIDLDTYTSLTHQYLKEYDDMYKVYTKGNCDILYEENDGMLLYEQNSKTYYGSAKNKEGAIDIVRLIPQDYDIFIVSDSIFEQLEKIEFSFIRKSKNENTIVYYNKEQK